MLNRVKAAKDSNTERVPKNSRQAYLNKGPKTNEQLVFERLAE